jgi:hypothetical protein
MWLIWIAIAGIAVPAGLGLGFAIGAARRDRRQRTAVLARAAAHPTGVVELGDFAFDVVPLVQALVDRARLRHAAEVLEPDRLPAWAVLPFAGAGGDVHVPGLRDVACPACGRRWPGPVVAIRVEHAGSRTIYDALCPRGHVVPSLAGHMVIH